MFKTEIRPSAPELSALEKLIRRLEKDDVRICTSLSLLKGITIYNGVLWGVYACVRIFYIQKSPLHLLLLFQGNSEATLHVHL